MSIGSCSSMSREKMPRIGPPCLPVLRARKTTKPLEFTEGSL